MSENRAESIAERRAKRRAARRGVKRFEPDASVPSPCISVCQIDNTTGLCIGCHRNIDEIRDWMIMTAEDKRQVLESIEIRKG